MKNMVLNIKWLPITLIILFSVGLLTIGAATTVAIDEEREYQNIEQSEAVDKLVRPEEEQDTPQYAPGELIVKLKEGSAIEDLQELNTTYNVASVDKVFKDISAPEDNLKQLKDKLANLSSEHDKWYWQLDKDSQEYKDYVKRTEGEKETLESQIKAQEELVARLQQRQDRVPQGAAPPNLDNVYILKAPEDTDISSMASEYQDDPAVEYAEPNYIVK